MKIAGPNNPFLFQVGIIAGGKKKQITDMGRKLSRALDHNLPEQISECWREVIRGNEFLSNIISTIRIKNGMAVDDLIGHVLYASGAKNTKANRTGAKTVADLLIVSNLVEDDAGKLRVATPVPQSSSSESEESPAPQLNHPVSSADVPSLPLPAAPVLSTSTNPVSPTIAINIQLQLPETDKPEVYDELFKALRRHLFPG
ncbi:hypothetical protein [Pseudomonas sp. Marseille-Q0931]|uniref:hypothetical protein n=1 Tax=Pseudomonas sp. Marseille-Q0931 TaxID=2697507 RepID=UPI0023B8C56E|nr:hypothetical protein [Pseudomonas sp. Marseille-Q0931]